VPIQTGGGVTASYPLQSRHWKEGVDQHHTPAISFPRKHPIPIVWEAGCVLGPYWTRTENPRTIQCVASRYTDYTISEATKTFRGARITYYLLHVSKAIGRFGIS